MHLERVGPVHSTCISCGLKGLWWLLGAFCPRRWWWVLCAPGFFLIKSTSRAALDLLSLLRAGFLSWLPFVHSAARPLAAWGLLCSEAVLISRRLPHQQQSCLWSIPLSGSRNCNLLQSCTGLEWKSQWLLTVFAPFFWTGLVPPQHFAWRRSSCSALFLCRRTILSLRLWSVWLGCHQRNRPWRKYWHGLSAICVPVPRRHGTCRIIGTIFSSWRHGRQKSSAEGPDCRPGGEQRFRRLAGNIVSWHHLGFARVPLPPCGVVCWHCLAVRQSHKRDYDAGTIAIGYSCGEKPFC